MSAFGVKVWITYEIMLDRNQTFRNKPGIIASGEILGLAKVWGNTKSIESVLKPQSTKVARESWSNIGTT